MMKKDLEYYLSLPYRVEIVPIPEEEGGGFLARLPQFGELGIIGDGDTVEEALSDLAESKKIRFQSYLNEGIDIPEPDQGAVEYSGRFLIRLPKYLHRQLAEAAQANGVSLNQYACTLLAMHYQEDRLSGILTGVYDELKSLNKMIGNLQYRMEPSKAVFRTYKWEYSADGYKAAA
jgi:predicted HicB family RNase H-like nuclease